MSIEINCNLCGIKPSDKAFKAPCQHAFCETCATKVWNEMRTCPRCNNTLSTVTGDSSLEFQIVGGPVLDEQLVDLKSMIVAIAVANGVAFLDSFITSLYKFEHEQQRIADELLIVKAKEELERIKQEGKAQSEQTMHLEQELNVANHRNSQLEKQFLDMERAHQESLQKLEDAGRQVQNWKAMYESIRSESTKLSSNQTPPVRRENSTAQHTIPTSTPTRATSSRIPSRMPAFTMEHPDNKRRRSQQSDTGVIASKTNSPTYRGQQRFVSSPTATQSGYSSDSGWVRPRSESTVQGLGSRFNPVLQQQQQQRQGNAEFSQSATQNFAKHIESFRWNNRRTGTHEAYQHDNNFRPSTPNSFSYQQQQHRYRGYSSSY